jgi:hypothetical protein
MTAERREWLPYVCRVANGTVVAVGVREFSAEFTNANTFSPQRYKEPRAMQRENVGDRAIPNLMCYFTSIS